MVEFCVPNMNETDTGGSVTERWSGNMEERLQLVTVQFRTT